MKTGLRGEPGRGKNCLLYAASSTQCHSYQLLTAVGNWTSESMGILCVWCVRHKYRTLISPQGQQNVAQEERTELEVSRNRIQRDVGVYQDLKTLVRGVQKRRKNKMQQRSQRLRVFSASVFGAADVVMRLRSGSSIGDLVWV